MVIQVARVVAEKQLVGGYSEFRTINTVEKSNFTGAEMVRKSQAEITITNEKPLPAKNVCRPRKIPSNLHSSTQIS